MEGVLSPAILKLKSIAEEVTQGIIVPKSNIVDEQACWPAHSMRGLAEADLLSLHMPKTLGGHEQGLLALAVIAETIGKGCSSSALCYGMHCVGSAVINAKATQYQTEKYLKPIADNQHITTLALSESGTGAHFYLPQTQLTLDEEHYQIHGCKQFVTNGSHADSYVVSTQIAQPDEVPGDFNCVVVDGATEGITWLESWQGLGMRGNSSRGMDLNGVRIPRRNLLGVEGDQIWYIFEVVAPYFLTAMAATYIGIAQTALDITIDHLTNRYYQHSGESLADIPTLQNRVAKMRCTIDKSRALLYQAAYKGDTGAHDAALSIMMAKVDAADTVIAITNDAMTCCGGKAYGENSTLARLLRDGRASHIMSPTSDMLQGWIGRSLLGLPLI
ncbi:acyl-CoA dehydrogenase family protein [Thalassotalea sp. G2M2-11]|uniref:acyl-CoA dehydrogenase family protein n=1 Tax=Thalassotalea sp. G2M2-11 TaxID=2787627 RepID=UPI0019D2844E|nr:acyl-CoA dehydrogenase family protein [Thalassotalea sp. G2M2-11]